MTFTSRQSHNVARLNMHRIEDQTIPDFDISVSIKWKGTVNTNG